MGTAPRCVTTFVVTRGCCGIGFTLIRNEHVLTLGENAHLSDVNLVNRSFAKHFDYRRLVLQD